MLVGTASISDLAKLAATIPSFVTAPTHLTGVVCFSMTAEMHNVAREAVLPPSLHPTVPSALTLLAYDVGESPWGAFRMAIVRVCCRSGVRARGFTTAAIASTESACEGLRSAFGYPVRVGSIDFQHGYAGAEIGVAADGRKVLDVRALDPEPMGPDDVQYTGTLNLAHTPKGLRLVQVEPDHHSQVVSRLRPRLVAFDAAAWGSPLLDPYRMVSSSLASGSVVIPPVRFVCRPDQLAFSGTEAVA